MDFKLTVLGTASAKPVTGRFQSAQVLSVRGRSFLIDCGEGVQTRLEDCHISHASIESIFISHIHGDHLFGLFGLLSTMGMLARPKPLCIYAPASFGPLLRFFLSYYGEGIAFEIRHVPLTMKAPETVYETKSLEVKAFPLNHGIETFGFLIREKEQQFNVRKWKIEEYSLSLAEIGAVKKGEDVVRQLPDGSSKRIPFEELGYKPFVPRSYAYCSDTAPFPELSSWVKGVDLLYHEATYSEDSINRAEQYFHSTAAQAAQVARDAHVGRLLIGHYSARYEREEVLLEEARKVFPPTSLTDENQVFDV